MSKLSDPLRDHLLQCSQKFNHQQIADPSEGVAHDCFRCLRGEGSWDCPCLVKFRKFDKGVEFCVFAAFHSVKSQMDELQKLDLLFEEEAKPILEDFFKIQNIIISTHVALAFRFAKRFASRTGLEENELLSEAMQALYRAALSFDPWRNFRFSSYASNAIIKAMARQLIRASKAASRGFLHPDPSLYMHPEQRPESDRSDEVLDLLIQVLQENKGFLDETEQLVVTRYYQLLSTEYHKKAITFADIGKDMDLTGSRIHQIKGAALKKLRAAMDAELEAAGICSSQ